jgi:hypothetical protein
MRGANNEKLSKLVSTAQKRESTGSKRSTRRRQAAKNQDRTTTDSTQEEKTTPKVKSTQQVNVNIAVRGTGGSADLLIISATSAPKLDT